MDEHENDFYNCFIKQPHAKEGPREPWHDIHSKVEGSIAHDVFANFFERWSKQCKREVRLSPLDPNLFDPNCLPPFTGIYTLYCFRELASLEFNSQGIFILHMFGAIIS